MGNTFQRAAPVNLEANREDEEGPSEGVQPVRAQKRFVLFTRSNDKFQILSHLKSRNQLGMIFI